MANKFLDANGLLYFWQKIVAKFATKDELNNNKVIVTDNLTSTSTTNALSANQGKVLDDKIKAINTNIGNLGGGDMLKSAYDTDNNGQVDKADDSDKLGGQFPSYYAKAEDLNNYVPTSTVGKASGVASLDADGKVPTSQLPETAPIEHKHTTKDITDFDTEMAKKADVSDLEDAVEEMTEIANGKRNTYVFNTESDLISNLAEYKEFIDNGTAMSETNVLNGVTLEIGDVFLIKEVKVPDYWWDGSDKSVLETTKVELSAISNKEIDDMLDKQ